MDDATPTPAFCIYINSFCEGPIPLWRDSNDLPVVYATRVEAEREIAEDLIDRLRDFLAGELEFEEAMDIEEFIVEVSVFPDGSITDEDDNYFTSRRSPVSSQIDKSC